jgi:(S)-2-hydroxyglutarate dehydrogenase
MRYDVAIIGGGIVGLATALKIKEEKPGLKICLLEKEKDIALHQTGNNSGVIHSGIYYKPGSLKAQNCLIGYKTLLDFCSKNSIKYDLCGKIIIATREDELPRLEDLFVRGKQNGLDKINKISSEEIKQYEPHATGIAGIYVPYTGIVDYRQICRKIAENFQSGYSGEIFTSTRVIGIIENKDSSILQTTGTDIEARMIVNTAGLFSDRIARLTFPDLNIRIIPFRGEYYKIRPEREYLVKNLIYPVPDPNFPFLGVHFTRMIKGEGGVEAGPNAVFAFKREGYKKTDISPKDIWESITWRGFQKVMFKYTSMGIGEFYRSYNKHAFTKALQRLIPEIKIEDLIPGGAGVRAQACDRNGKLVDDFLFAETEKIIHVLNAPSPAATASFSIGKSIADKVIKRF